ncbi:hypothetical protein J4221_06130 [Candidatus Pacearchaeota archaeon]|nr:hypothetical protein [Candidatus Pacearchaeota archaeon]
MENYKTLAEKFIEGFDNRMSFIQTQNEFPFEFPLCLREIASKSNQELFQRVVEGYVSYSQRVNRGRMESEKIKLEALDLIEFQCIIADTGRMTIGIPGFYNLNGITRQMFLDLYSGQLAENKGYKITHSIKP